MSGCKTSYLSYFLINYYEMVKVTVRLKQLVVSVFLFLGFISHWVNLLLTLLVNYVN